MKQTKDDVSKLVYINGKHQERMFWNKSKRMPLFSNLYVQGRVLEFNDMYIKESWVQSSNSVSQLHTRFLLLFTILSLSPPDFWKPFKLISLSVHLTCSSLVFSPSLYTFCRWRLINSWKVLAWGPWWSLLLGSDLGLCSLSYQYIVSFVCVT